MANADGLFGAIDGLLGSEGIERVVLDGENVRECDSHGLQLLLNLHRGAGARGKELILYRPSSILTAALHDGGLVSLFPVFDTLEG